MDVKEKSVKDRIASAQKHNELHHTKQDAALLAIGNRLDDTNRMISAGNATTSRIADALRLDWLRQLGSDLKGFMHRIMAMNIATYHAVVSIQSTLPGRLERSLSEEPFILEDAIGRIAPVHLQFVTSWEAFNAVLEIRFRDIQGFQKIKERQYGLQEKATRREIDQSRPWERSFLPGQRVEMSFIFDATDDECPKDPTKVTCPGCFTQSDTTSVADVQCHACGMWFRRITIIQETEPPPQMPMPRPWQSKSEFGKTGFNTMISGPPRPGKRRSRPSEIEDVDIREFKRVRMIAKREKVLHRKFGRVATINTLGFANLSTRTSTEKLLLNPTQQPWKNLQASHTSWKNTILEDKDMIDANEVDDEELRREELIERLTSGISAKAEPQPYNPALTIVPQTMVKPMPDDYQEGPSLSSPIFEKLDPSSTFDARFHPAPLHFIEIPSAFEVYRDLIEPQLDVHSSKTKDQRMTWVRDILKEEKKHAEDGVTLYEGAWLDSDLWPDRGVTSVLSLYYDKLLYGDETTFRAVPPGDELGGLHIKIPHSGHVLYGAGLGRLIFEWTYELYEADVVRERACYFWNALQTLDEMRRKVIQDRLQKHLKWIEGCASSSATEQLTDIDMPGSKIIVYAHYVYWELESFLLRNMGAPDNIEDKRELGRFLVWHTLAWARRYWRLVPSDTSLEHFLREKVENGNGYRP
jgi:hypothetical protein